MLSFLAGPASLVQGLGEFHKLADEQIKPPIVVIIEPDRARGPSRRGQAGHLGHIAERAVAIVVVKDASAILRNVQVRETVAIVIAHCDSLAVPAGRYSSFHGHIGECAVTIIPTQRVP